MGGEFLLGNQSPAYLVSSCFLFLLWFPLRQHMRNFLSCVCSYVFKTFSLPHISSSIFSVWGLSQCTILIRNSSWLLEIGMFFQWCPFYFMVHIFISRIDLRLFLHSRNVTWPCQLSTVQGAPSQMRGHMLLEMNSLYPMHAPMLWLYWEARNVIH